MKIALPKVKSASEHERDLWIASGLYMRGKLSMEQLEVIGLSHTQNLKEAVLALAKRNLEQRLFLPRKIRKYSIKIPEFVVQWNRKVV